MKKKFIAFWKENFVYLLSFLIPLLLWTIIFIIKGYEPFGINTLLTNDGVHQYYPFFSLYREKLVNMKSLFYSFSGGLGFDFYSLWAYYMASPLSLFVVLFPAQQLSAVLNVLIVLKMCFGGFAFSYYLGNHGDKKDLRIVMFACAYTLSSYMIADNFNIMWLDAIALFPIIVIGLERLLKENKWKLYTFSLFLSIWCNYYISFMICIFLVIWFLFYEFKNVKDFFIKGLKFAGYSILGAALAAIVLIPTFIATSQITTDNSIPDFIYYTRFTDIFISDVSGGIFAFRPLVKVTVYAYMANLYCGMFVLGLMILYFINSNIKLSRRIKSFLLLLILILSLNNQFLNYVWHGFRAQRGIPNRFVFILVFLALVLAYTSLRDIKLFKWWMVSLSGVGVLGVFALLYFLKVNNTFSISQMLPSIMLVIGYTFIELLINVKWITKTFAATVLLVIACCELLLNAHWALGEPYGLKQNFRYPADVEAAKETLGNTPYRVEMNNPIIYNEGLTYGLQGTGIFNTMAKSYVLNTLKGIGYSGDASRYNYETGTPVINTLFGVKNIFNFKEDAARLEDRYSLVNTIGQVDIYENPYVLPIGYMINEEATDWTGLQSDVFQNQMDLLKRMTGNDYAIFDKMEYNMKANDIRADRITAHEIEYFGCTNERKDNLVFTTTATEDKDIFIFIEGTLNKNLQIKINDTIIADKTIRNQYYHVGKVYAGDVITINIGISTEDITYTNMFLDIFSYNRSEMDKAYNDLSKETLQVSNFSDTYIKGTITNSTDRALLLTIPFDIGWTIKVDGQVAQKKVVGNAFLGVDLKAGSHTIELTYISPGFLLGLAISVVAVIAVAVLIILERKKKKNKSQEL